MPSKNRFALFSLTLVAIFAFAPAKSFAGILLEPSLGYAMGDLKVGIVSGIGGGEIKYSLKGPSLGARIGYAFPLVFLALDTTYITGSSKVDSDEAPNVTGLDSDIKSTIIGGVVGLSLPMIRVFAGPYKERTKSDSSSSSSELLGDGIKAGLSFTGLPFVAINLEYFSTEINKVKSDGVEYDVGAGTPVYESAKSTTLLVSVSLPLEF